MRNECMPRPFLGWFVSLDKQLVGYRLLVVAVPDYITTYHSSGCCINKHILYMLSAAEPQSAPDGKKLVFQACQVLN